VTASPTAGVEARRLATTALMRIAVDGAYANLVLPPLLDHSGLEDRDRRFVTELVYGTTRMQRACDWLVDRFVRTELDPTARAILRLGAYQLVMLGTPAHAAVSATVESAPRKLRGLVNAVLRRVATAPHEWPNDGIRLSYPDWILDTLRSDLGPADAEGALAAMNEAATVTGRADGYVQDRASQEVAAAVDAQPGDVVLDVCAAPGGKATFLAGRPGVRVVAADLRPGRLGLVRTNVDRLDQHDRVALLAQDGTRPALRPESFDRVLLDAPCSGLGSLRRRPDARWRIAAEAVPGLADLQRRLIGAAVPLLRPGGVLIYSVCTLTAAEGPALDDHLAAAHPDLVALPPPGAPWTPVGRGARLLPQDAGTDGMYVLQLRRN
jgi:16S rRNA (cytosine967-C5)-methyltransferase